MKEKFKKFVKNKKLFWSVIGTAIFLIVGLLMFIIGAYASGWHVLACLITPNAFFWYFVILLVVVPILIYALIYYFAILKDDKNGRK